MSARLAALIAFCVATVGAAVYMGSWWVALAGGMGAFGLHHVLSRPQGRFELLRREGRPHLRPSSSRDPLGHHGDIRALDFRWSYNHHDGSAPRPGTKEGIEGAPSGGGRGTGRAPANAIQLRLDISLAKGTRLTVVEPLGNWASTPPGFDYAHFAPAEGEHVLFAACSLRKLRRAAAAEGLLPAPGARSGRLGRAGGALREVPSRPR